jgi:hypothetical protein
MDNSFPVDDSWAHLVHGLVIWADLGHVLVARDLDVHGHFHWDSHWDVNILVFWDAYIFLFDDSVRDDFLAVHWDWDGFVVVARLLDNDWNLVVDAAVNSTAALVASFNCFIEILIWPWNHLC